MIVAWVQNFLLYCYGELIDTNQKCLLLWNKIITDNNKMGEILFYSYRYITNDMIKSKIEKYVKNID